MALRYILRGLPDDGTCDASKHVGDLLTSDVYILMHVKLVSFYTMHGTTVLK
jgi:hypothetical protein